MHDKAARFVSYWSLIGVLTWLSLIGFVILIINSVTFSMTGRGSSIAGLPLFLGLILLNAILFLYYFRNIIRNDRVPIDRRDLWTIITFVAGPVGQLLYFYKYVAARYGKNL